MGFESDTAESNDSGLSEEEAAYYVQQKKHCKQHSTKVHNT